MPSLTRRFDPTVDNIYVAYEPGQTVKVLAEQEQADFAINFNFATPNGVPIGLLTVDGVIEVLGLPKTAARDSLYQLPDKSLHIGKPTEDAVWSVQGSPPLLRNGKPCFKEGIIRDQTPDDIAKRPAARTAVGITADGHLIVYRSESLITIETLTNIMLGAGCVQALNGDGGGSSYFWPADKGQFGRKLGSALVIKKGVAKPVPEEIELMIDPGHGGSDPGAVGNGIIEKEYTLKISQYMCDRLTALGVKVRMTRYKDESVDSTQRAAIVKNSGAKYCISNHINAAPSAQAIGAEVIHSIHNVGALANVITRKLRDAGQRLRPNPYYSKSNEAGSDYYFMHRLTGNVQTNIVEYGFLSNKEDAERIKANWQKYAEAVVEAYCIYTNRKYVPLAPPAPPAPPKEPTTTQEPDDIASVVLNGKLLAHGKIEKGTTYVPVRAIAEALGLDVKWDQATKTVSLNKK